MAAMTAMMATVLAQEPPVDVDVIAFLLKFSVGGLPGLGLVWLLVELWKKLFPTFDTGKLPWVATGAGMLVALLIIIIDYIPAVEGVVVVLVAGLLMGLASMGIHSGIKTIRGFRSVPPGSTVELPGGNTVSVPAQKV